MRTTITFGVVTATEVAGGTYLAADRIESMLICAELAGGTIV